MSIQSLTLLQSPQLLPTTMTAKTITIRCVGGNDNGCSPWTRPSPTTKWSRNAGKCPPSTSTAVDNKRPVRNYLPKLEGVLPLPPTPRPRTIPLPSQIASEIDQPILLHPALVYGGDDVLPPFEFDFSMREQHTKIPFAVAREPATYPALPSIAITNQRLPWPIVIHPSSESRGWVTVSDVLLGIQQSLRTPVDELQSLDGAFHTCKDGAKRMKRQMQRRIDCLHGSCRFQGLSSRKEDGDTWELHVC